MVMEAPPTPQCVGREFVRQYYTLLNKAPAHLHRFYNNNSSFVHGGLDAPNRETKPMVGQRQIHQKIQQLNFRDCHAKISQVDSQATLGDGVVVQVSGELSNGGQPMRRFTQTFVLAAQSPKKYYVHNDIFRYQDMLMSDEDVEHDSGRSETEEDPEPADSLPPVTQQPPQQPPPQTQAYYQQPHPQPTHPMMGSGPVQIMPPAVNGMLHVDELAAALPAVPPQPQAPQVAQAAQAPLLGTPLVPPQQPQVQPQPQPQLEEEQPALEESVEEHAEIHEEQHGEPDASESPEEPEEQIVQEEKSEPALLEPYEEQHSEAVLNEPKTYATLLKSSSAAMPGLPQKQTPTSPPPMQRAEAVAVSGPPPSSGGPQRPGMMARPARGASSSVRGVGRQSIDRQGSGRPPYSDDSDSERRRSGPSGSSSTYPDSNQLFLGNLPLHATEEELKKLFSTYGTVADLRIHSKSTNTKGGPVGSKVPNYGFITFEDAASVQNVLQKRPIYFDNTQKLNVEEKKPRRLESNSGPRSGPGDMGRPNSGMSGNTGRGGQSGAPRGGGGSGMRGRGGSGNFSRGEGGPGGPRGGGINNSGSRGSFSRR